MVDSDFRFFPTVKDDLFGYMLVRYREEDLRAVPSNEVPDPKTFHSKAARALADQHGNLGGHARALQEKAANPLI